jgi:hypothetical protein
MMHQNDFPYYSKHRTEDIAKESVKLVQTEHEIHQEQGHDITKDDLLNLKITLGVCKTVDELIEVI